MWLPRKAPPWPGMVILHGAGSAKENHADFGRACAAGGWAALSYDCRGHGESREPMTPEALADVSRMARFLATQPGVDGDRVCVRGSSMGGYLAILATASTQALAGAIAICPASAAGLRRGLRSDDLGFRADAEGLDAWIAEHELVDSVGLISPRPLILLHARGDERVPCEHSERLYAAAGDPRKLIVVPGGSHRSVQHDAELQGVALSWLGRQL